MLIPWHTLLTIDSSPFHAAEIALEIANIAPLINALMPFQIACTVLLIALQTVLIVDSRPFHAAETALTMAFATPLTTALMPFQMPETALDNADRILETSLFRAVKSPVTKSQITNTTPSTRVLM